MKILSLEQQKKLIKENVKNIKEIENLYEEVCLDVVKVSGYNISLIPSNKQTMNVCLQAVRKNGSSIQCLPEEKQTEEICLTAVKQNGWAIQWISEEKQTEEICIEAVKKHGRAIECISEEKQTLNVCLEAVKQNGNAIQYVKNRTPQVCFYAFLNKFSLINKKYIKDGINDFIEQEMKLRDIVFCQNKTKNKKKINKKFGVDKEIVDVDIESLKYLINYLIAKNEKNHFVLEGDVDMDILLKISISDNELILVDRDNLSNIQKKISNCII